MANDILEMNILEDDAPLSVSVIDHDPYYVGAEAKVETVPGGAKVTCKDKDGTTMATVYNGEKGDTGPAGPPGQDGSDGQDGISPSVSVEEIAGGHEISITDAEGTTTFDVMDGQDGQDGADGQDGSDGADGFSPSASVSKVGDTATITITDKDGTTTATISDGSIANEQDPVFTASAAYGIASSDITAWNNKSDFSGDYDDLENKPSIPSKTSDLVNDAGYITGYTETDPTVPSWAKQVSKPSYTASEVGALPDTTVIPSSLSDLTNDMAVSDFTNDAGYITGYTETDPTVPSWAKASTKPSYTASEVGALPDTTVIPSALSDLTNDLDVSDFPNDAGYLTQHQDISGKADKVDTDIDASVTTLYTSLGWTPPS